MNVAKILVVDAEPQMRRLLRAILSAQDYQVVEARSGEDALHQLDAQLYDFVLLALNLPGMDGIATCRAIRARSDVPIVVVTIRKSEQDTVAALKAGADDYVTKPFRVAELLARIEAVARRKPVINRPSNIWVLDGVRIDLEKRTITAQDREEHLTPKEVELLRYMVLHAGQAVPHRRLLQAVWSPDHSHEIEYLRVFVNSLRRKIERDAHRPRYLLTEHCVGYRFAPPPNVVFQDAQAIWDSGVRQPTNHSVPISDRSVARAR